MIDDVMRANQRELDRLVAARSGKAAFGPTWLEVGDARAVIAEIATRLGADLIVMGTHGRSGLAHALLGSVAERVVQHAHCPVLIVPKRPA
jgi:nucleotide-binding universal stress UspA family protein